MLKILDCTVFYDEHYEANYLDGVADAHWAGWYAAYTLGRLGDFTTPTTLARLLAESPAEADWPAAAARHVTQALRDA